ncbi:MAG: M6 family metalloprotease domain-containing protein [Prevotella sp.]|nr:M6 family metalloprotease domain-containing protein [Prevotella sp.]
MTNLFNLQKAKPLFVLIMLLCMSAALWAVPAKPGLKRVLTLTDGTTITAQLVGDEHGHFWLGQDGRAYQAVSGSDVFQLIDKTEVTKRAQTRRAAANQQRMRRLAPRKVGSIGNYTGQKKGLIILANFKDVSFNASNNNALYQDIANKPNFKEGNFKGSMYDYFYAQSEGQFELTFDIVGPVEVSNTSSYYGANDSQGNDKYPAKMVIEALKKADPDVNYADYDWDGDGEVEQVYVVYAGKGEADGGAATTIWPHEWQLSAASYYGDGSGAQLLDGVKIDTYACGGELNGSTGTVAGIGTMCHEFSHCLGYPDFYDTDYSGGQGMFEWDLMDSGSYNGDGYQPAGYTGWERWQAGWKEPIELLNTQAVTGMKALADGGDTYIIYNQGNKNEYYMLENRQQMKWDGGVPGEGLLIVHVDYSASVWANNEPNNDPSHQRMTWVAADNEYQYTTYQGSKYYTTAGAKNDPFPYGSVNAFNKSTTPAAKFYNKNLDGTYYLDSSIEEITQWSDGTISFNFRGVSNVSKPTFSPAAGRYAEAQTVTISCETEGATIYYTLNGTEPTTSSTAYSEPLTISETTTIKAIAVKDGEESEVATAKYTIGTSVSDPNTTTFKRVASVADLEPGMRYIIACGSKSTAAGALSNQILSSESVTVSGDVITIGDGVSVFVLEETANGWTFQNESTNQYLYATAAKKLAYSNTPNAWTLANGTAGVIMTYGSYGTMLYNANNPRFTTYTSSPTTSMIQANLYMEYSSEVTVEKQDVTLTFQPQTITGTMGEDGRFVEPSLKMEPADAAITVTYSSNNERVATVEASTGEVTFVAPGTAVITASFGGDDHYNAATPATYTLTVLAADQPVQGTGRYQLVTSTDDLESGKNYLIVSGTKAYNGFNTNKGDAGDVTISENVIDLSQEGNEAVPVVLTKESGSTWGTYWSIYDTGVEAYLTALSGNKLGTTNSYSFGRPSWTIAVSSTGTATIQNYNNDAYLKYNSKDDMFRAYSSGQTAVSLYKEIEEPVVEEITVSIGSTGYATLYYSDKNLTVPEGVDAYTYTITDGKLEESWLYEADEVIPQGTAVILKDLVTLEEGETSHDYAFTVTTTEGDVDNDNLLMGFDEDAETVGPDGATEGYKFYMLSLDKNSTPGSVGFYYAKNCPHGEAFTSKGHKAYLPVDVTAASGKSFFLFGDAQSGTTDIDNVQSSKLKAESADIYDLSGRKMGGGKLQPGIYIKNGRKVVVK